MIQRLRDFRADMLLLVAFFLLPLLLFADVTLGGQTLLPADNLFQWQPWASAAATYGVETVHNSLLSDLILQNYVWKQFIRESLAAGEIPLWNPHLFAGAPFLATGQSAAYYPFSIFFLLLPLAQAYGWYTVSQLWLAGVFMYIFARLLGMGRPAATIAGLVFQGAGFMLVSAAVFPMIVGAAIWLPLLLASIEMVIRVSSSPRGAGKTLPWAILGAVALGCQILAGHIEITYYTLLVMAAYAGWRLLTRAFTVRDNRRLLLAKPAAWLLGLVLLGLMLGGVQFIPFYEVGQANFREGSATLAEVRGWAFPPRRVLTLAVPNFYGSPADHTYVDVFSGRQLPFTTNYYGDPNPHGAGSSAWGMKNYVEGGIYLGILPLFLAFLALYSFCCGQRAPARTAARGPRSAILFFVLLSLFSLAFIFGTPLYAILYYGLPGINQLHSPFRWIFPLSLAVAALAGFGMEYLAATRREKDSGEQPRSWASDNRPSRWLQPFVLWGRPSLITTLAGLAFWGGLLLLAGLLLSRPFYDSLVPLLQPIFLGLARAPDAFPDLSAFYSYQFRNLFLFALMLTASGIVLRVSRCPLYLWRRQPLWPFLAAVVIGLDLLLANFGFHTAADPALLDHKPEMVEWLEQQPGLWRLTSFAPHGDKPFNANAGWLYGFQDVRGYDSIIPRQYTDYMRAIEPQNELQFNRVQPIASWQALNSPLLDLLGVKYVITAETIDLPKLELAWQGEGLRIYENLGVVPRAYTIPRTATALVDEPLAAMQQQDPRAYLFLDRDDLAGGQTFSSGPPVPAALQPATVTAYSNIEVTVDATVAEPAWLVLNDSFFPGWKLFVRPQGAPADSEQEQQIYRVNSNFRGVLLEPGAWTVRFRYSPMSFKLGGLTSAMAGVILLFVFAIWLWRRFYDSETELTNTRSIAKNSLVPTALNLLNRFIDFLFAAFYLRLLGPADAGSYANAIAVAGWFEIISNFGLNTLVIREVSQEKEQASRYLLNTITLRLGTSLMAAIPVFIYLWVSGIGDNPLRVEAIAAILLLMVGMFFSGTAQSFTGLFYAYETAEAPAAIATVTTILKVGFGVLVLLLGYGFVGLAGISILVNLVTLAILALVAFRTFDLRGPWQINLRLQRRILVQSYPLMLNHLLANIFFFIDVPLMRQFNGEEPVGWYNSAYKWVNAINVIPSFFTFALFPVISRQIQIGLDDARRTFRMSIKLMVWLALPIAAVTTLLAPTLIGMLGGREFLPDGAIALQLVIWSIPIGWINSVTNYVLIALGQERMQIRAFVAGVSFNLLLNLLLLPPPGERLFLNNFFTGLYSYRAAAVITIFSEVVLLVVFNVYLRQRLPGVGWLSLLWRPVAVTAGMLLVMGLGAQLHLLLGLSLGLLLYPAGLWALGTFGEEEKRILRSLLPASLVARLRIAEGG